MCFRSCTETPCNPKRSPLSEMTCPASATAVSSLLPVPNRIASNSAPESASAPSDKSRSRGLSSGGSSLMVYLRVPTAVFYIIQASARWYSPRDRGSDHSPAQEGKRVGGYEQSERVGRLGEEKDLCKRDLAAAGSVSQTTLGRVGRDQGVYSCSGGALGMALWGSSRLRAWGVCQAACG